MSAPQFSVTNTSSTTITGADTCDCTSSSVVDGKTPTTTSTNGGFSSAPKTGRRNTPNSDFSPFLGFNPIDQDISPSRGTFAVPPQFGQNSPSVTLSPLSGQFNLGTPSPPLSFNPVFPPSPQQQQQRATQQQPEHRLDIDSKALKPRDPFYSIENLPADPAFQFVVDPANSKSLFGQVCEGQCRVPVPLKPALANSILVIRCLNLNLGTDGSYELEIPVRHTIPVGPYINRFPSFCFVLLRSSYQGLQFKLMTTMCQYRSQAMP